MSDNLKNKLDQEQLEFDTSAAWEQLAPKLDSNKRKRRGFIWWWVGGSASVAFLVFAMLYLLPQDSSTEPPAVFAEANQVEASKIELSSETVESAPLSISEEKSAGVYSSDALFDVSSRGSSEESPVINLTSKVLNEGDDNLLSTSLNNSHKIVAYDSGSIQFLQENITTENASTPYSIFHQDNSLGVGGGEDSELTPSRSKADLDQSRSNQTSDGLTSADIVASSKLPYLNLLPFELEGSEQLGRLPEMPMSRIPYGKLTTKPYWQVGILGGVGKEILSSTNDNFRINGRTILETRSMQLDVKRSFSKRFAVTAHAHILQRQELYRTDLTELYSETVYNPVALVAGGERFGDSVSVLSTNRVRSDRYATLTRLNVGAVGEYLVPTRSCDYGVYAGVNFALVQRWNGSRMVQRVPIDRPAPEEMNPIIEDTEGPYSSLNNRLSFIIGTRVSKPLGRQLNLLFDGRAVLNSHYAIESPFDELFTETGHTFTVSLGLGWRFE